MSETWVSVQLRQAGPIPLEVEFTCKNKEILVIVGPSGSGKSTVLRCIAGLYKPTTGKIVCCGQTWFDNETQRDIPIQRRRIGLVSQHYALFPHLTALDNISIALGQAEKENRTRRAKQLLQMVNMEGLEKRRPHQLSGGQQQRIALARALARKPDVLLLDEPFSAVDQQTRRKLVRELVQLRSRLHMPIIHVTHDLNEARRIADKICIIHHGKTLQTDTPHKIMSNPENADVAYLTGHYNIFTGAIHGHDHAQQKTFIRWFEYTLEAFYRPEFAAGDRIDWVIPAENIILHRRDRPSKGERENPVKGAIEEFIPLGESSSVTIRVNDNQELLSMSVPTHVARRNDLARGRAVSVSLLCAGIHLMKKV